MHVMLYIRALLLCSPHPPRGLSGALCTVLFFSHRGILQYRSSILPFCTQFDWRMVVIGLRLRHFVGPWQTMLLCTAFIMELLSKRMAAGRLFCRNVVAGCQCNSRTSTCASAHAKAFYAPVVPIFCACRYWS